MKWYKVWNNLLQDQLWEDIGWITRVNVLILLLAWTTPVRRWRVFWIFLPDTQSRVPNCTSLLCVRCSDEILFSRILEIGLRVPVQDISWKRRWPHTEFFKAVYRTPVSAYLSMYEIFHCSWTTVSEQALYEEQPPLTTYFLIILCQVIRTFILLYDRNIKSSLCTTWISIGSGVGVTPVFRNRWTRDTGGW